mgnify:CR=1 FL=1
MRRITPEAAEYAVDGIAATGSAGAPRSSPAAAQRFAQGNGLNGGAPDRSRIRHAADHSRISPERRAQMAASATLRIYTSLTDMTLGEYRVKNETRENLA